MDVEVFIGDLEDPSFHYEGGNWSGNMPKRISALFPNPHKVFSMIVNKIANKEIMGRQTDWGSWTAVLYPGEILEVLTEAYGEETCAADNEVRDIGRLVGELDAAKQYGLVACEMS